MNHDNTEGTVDLFSKYTLINGGTTFSDNTQYYTGSLVRSYFTGTVYDGFKNEIKNGIKTQSFPSNGSILSDKVKCPSLTEVGVSAYSYVNEGTVYPIFGGQSNPNTNSIYKNQSGETVWYWTRSRYTNNADSVWAVGSDGYSGRYPYYRGDGYGAVVCMIACIRF